jgi:hypothetical protein
VIALHDTERKARDMGLGHLVLDVAVDGGKIGQAHPGFCVDRVQQRGERDLRYEHSHQNNKDPMCLHGDSAFSSTQYFLSAEEAYCTKCTSRSQKRSSWPQTGHIAPKGTLAIEATGVSFKNLLFQDASLPCLALSHAMLALLCTPSIHRRHSDRDRVGVVPEIMRKSSHQYQQQEYWKDGGRYGREVQHGLVRDVGNGTFYRKPEQ